MRRFSLALYCIFTLFSTAMSYQSLDNKIRYDGFYKSEIKLSNGEISYHLLRFFDDGTVITGNTVGRQELDFEWFIKDNGTVNRGLYVIEDTKLSFIINSKLGKIKYIGQIVGNRLHLNLHELEIERRSNAIFEFLPISSRQSSGELPSNQSTVIPEAKPFGLRMGMSLVEIGGTHELINPGFYKLSNVPRPHSAFEAYAARVAPKIGLCYIQAAGKNIETSSYGYELIMAFNEMESKLEALYGRHKKVDELFSGSIWNEPNEWMMGLIQKERVLVATWERKDGSTLPDNLINVGLVALPIDRNTGYIMVDYTFSNYQEGIKAISAQEDDAL